MCVCVREADGECAIVEVILKAAMVVIAALLVHFDKFYHWKIEDSHFGK